MRIFLLLILIILYIPGQLLYGQDSTDKSKFDIGVDFSSCYIWRGNLVDPEPNIQPLIEYSYKNLSVGFWGSSNFSGSYKEIDLYAVYNAGPFSLTITDYFWDIAVSDIKYFNYDNDSTRHVFEGTLSYTISEKFPLKLSAGTIFYGDDKSTEETDTKRENLYSSYFEVLYPFKLSGKEIEASLGYSPWEGYYGTGPGFVNLMLTASREIKITDHFSLPVKGSLIFNPQRSAAYFMLIITL